MVVLIHTYSSTYIYVQYTYKYIGIDIPDTSPMWESLIETNTT